MINLVHSLEAVIIEFVVACKSYESTPGGTQRKEYLYSCIAPHLEINEIHQYTVKIKKKGNISFRLKELFLSKIIYITILIVIGGHIKIFLTFALVRREKLGVR